jgi:hypothetical protein
MVFESAACDETKHSASLDAGEEESGRRADFKMGSLRGGCSGVVFDLLAEYS